MVFIGVPSRNLCALRPTRRVYRMSRGRLYSRDKGAHGTHDHTLTLHPRLQGSYTGVATGADSCTSCNGGRYSQGSAQSCTKCVYMSTHLIPHPLNTRLQNYTTATPPSQVPQVHSQVPALRNASNALRARSAMSARRRRATSARTRRTSALSTRPREEQQPATCARRAITWTQMGV